MTTKENTMGKLQDKVALITGSDSGIGQATAIAFASEGADVIVNYLEDQDGANHTRQEVEAHGRKAIVVQADHGHEDQVEKMFRESLDTFGHIDILMNNASVDASGTYVADLEIEDFVRSLRSNLIGQVICCKHFINHRKAAGGGGRIINTTSVHQERPRAGAADYDCSKGALRNLTRTLVLEVSEHGITVNNIAPGMVLTHTLQPESDRRPRVPGKAGGDHPTQAGRPARRGRRCRRLPRLPCRRLRHRLHLRDRRRPHADARIRRLTRDETAHA